MTKRAAMIFAAGFGTRMGDLTRQTPKPLIKVAGRPLIDHALDLTHCDVVGRRVVNSHYFPDQIETHLATHQNLKVIRETPDILETGGGLKNALPLLGSDPVFTLNSDAIWTGPNPLLALQAAWDPDKMDGLLMLLPRANAQEHGGAGDFFAHETGRLERRNNRAEAPFVYSGAQILRTEGLAAISETAFSLNRLWDQMIARRRIYGIVHPGGWVDVGRPLGIKVAEAELQRSADV